MGQALVTGRRLFNDVAMSMELVAGRFLRLVNPFDGCLTA